MVEPPPFAVAARKPITTSTPISTLSKKAHLERIIETIWCIAEKRERLMKEKWLLNNAKETFAKLGRPRKMEFDCSRSFVDNLHAPLSSPAKKRNSRAFLSLRTLTCRKQKNAASKEKGKTDAKIERDCAAAVRKILKTVEKMEKVNKKAVEAKKIVEARKSTRRFAGGKDMRFLGLPFHMHSSNYRKAFESKDPPFVKDRANVAEHYGLPDEGQRVEAVMQLEVSDPVANNVVSYVVGKIIPKFGR